MRIYKAYFEDDGEFFEYDAFAGQGSMAAQRAFPYLESLLSFLEMDREEWEHLQAEAANEAYMQ